MTKADLITIIQAKEIELAYAALELENLRVELGKYDDNKDSDNVDISGYIINGHYKGLRYVNDEVGYVDKDEEYY